MAAPYSYLAPFTGGHSKVHAIRNVAAHATQLLPLARLHHFRLLPAHHPSAQALAEAAELAAHAVGAVDDAVAVAQAHELRRSVLRAADEEALQ